MFGTYTQKYVNSSRRGRQCKSPTITGGQASLSEERMKGVNFTPLGQHHGQGLYSELGHGFGHSGEVGGGNCFIPGTGGGGQFLPTTQALRDIAFQTGMGKSQHWMLPPAGREGFALPVGNGGFGHNVVRHDSRGMGGQDRNWNRDQGRGREESKEFRMSRNVSPGVVNIKAKRDCGNNYERSERNIGTRSPSRRGGRCPRERSSNRLSGGREVSGSASVFGDKGVVDPWGNWQRKKDVSVDDCGERSSCSRKRETRITEKKPRSGRRATSIRKDRSSSRSSRVSEFRYGGGRVKNTADMDEKMERQEKRLTEKKRYEEERLKQVKRREDNIFREEEKFQHELKRKEIDAQEKIDYIKREERRVKQLEIERLKREKDLYLREKLLKEQRERKSEERGRSPIIQRGRSPWRRSPFPKKVSSARSLRHDFKVSTSVSSSPVQKEPIEKIVRVISASSSVSPLRPPFRRSPRPKSNASGGSKNNRCNVNKIDTTRVVVERKKSSEKCNQCGGPFHGLRNSLRERKLECPAYGLKCRLCSRFNHLAKVCCAMSVGTDMEIDDMSVLDRLGSKLPVRARLGVKKNKSFRRDEEEVANNNNYDREVFTTVDEIGYTEISAKEIEVKELEKIPVDLDKIIIKKRIKKI